MNLIRALVQIPCPIFNPTQSLRMDTPSSMKPRNEKPSAGMRFFTPELYLRVNSRDEDVADQAAEEWDAAIEAYRNNLDSLKLPEDVRLLTSMCLHDADWIPSRAHVRQTAIPRVASISVQQGDSAHVLVYLLVAPPTKWQAQDWPFSKDRVHWLYDEIDASRSEQRGHY